MQSCCLFKHISGISCKEIPEFLLLHSARCTSVPSISPVVPGCLTTSFHDYRGPPSSDVWMTWGFRFTYLHLHVSISSICKCSTWWNWNQGFLSGECFIIARKKPMVDLASLRLNSIWVPQHILISAPLIATVRDQTGECFCFLQTTVTGYLSHKGEGGYKVEIVFTWISPTKEAEWCFVRIWNSSMVRWSDCRCYS